MSRHYQCDEVTLFGYSTVVGAAVDGGQADYVRVPFAHQVLGRRPAELPEDSHAVIEAVGSNPALSAAVQAAGSWPPSPSLVL
jgi:threonine dehydrogenase-like Zn-dependent dehydrogenase